MKLIMRMLFICFLSTLLCGLRGQGSVTDIVREISAELKPFIEKQEPIKASRIISKFPLYANLPSPLRSFFDNVLIEKATLTEEKEAFTILGEAKVFGQPVQIRYMGTTKVLGGHTSLLIGLPESYKLSELMNSLLGLKPIEELVPELQRTIPGFKQSDVADLAFEKVALIVATGSYDDEEWGDIDQGINIAGTVRLTGLAENISKLVGENLTQVRLRGVFALPDITDSILQVSLPRTIQLLPFLKGVEAGPWAIEIGFKEVSALAPGIKLPAFAVTNNFLRITPEFFPLLSKPVSVTARVDIQPDKGNFSAWIEGEALIPSAQQIINLFPKELTAGLPFINITRKIPSFTVGGELGLTLSIDWALLGTTGIPVSGVGGRWAFSLGDRKIGLALKAEISSAGGIGDVVFDAELAGRYSLRDVAFDFADFVREASRELGQEINVRDALKDIIPTDLALEDVRLTIAPKDASIAGKSYLRGFALQGKMDIFGLKAEVDIAISKRGISLMGTMSPLDIRLQGQQLLVLTHATDKTKGPLIDLQCNPARAYFILSGDLQVPPLGLSSTTDINILLTSMQAKLTNKLLFGLYQSDLELYGDIVALFKTPEAQNFYLKIVMEQSVLSFLEKAVTKFAKEVVPDFDVKSQAEFDRVAGEVGRLERERDREYDICTKEWKWDWLRCRLFWGEIVKRQAEIDGLVLYRDLLLKPGVTIARGALTAFSDITQLAAQILARGFNIESFVSEARLSEFIQKGSLPKVSMRVKFLGRDVELKDMQFSFTDIPRSMEQIFGQLQKLVGVETPPAPAVQPSGTLPKIGRPLKISGA